MDLSGKLQIKPGQSVAVRGVQPVRQVSIDDTWSALRFRPAAG
jgi:hypothetical protein